MRRCVVIAALLAISCTRETPSGPSSNAFPITGRVIDYRTQSAIAGAVVRFSNPTFGVQEAVADARGVYSVSIPAFDVYSVSVNGSALTGIGIWTTQYRGDLFVGTAGCRGRYGVVVDATSLKPIAGATVQVAGTHLTGTDGWYYADGGCTPIAIPGGTAVMTVVHPAYETATRIVGRGLQGFLRDDFKLERKVQ